MKIRKLAVDALRGDAVALGALANVIVAIDVARRSTAPSLDGSGEFQDRCATAIVAVADQILERIERNYRQDLKRFRVSFDVKRVGNHMMEVDAETKEDAENLVQNKLDQMENRELDDMKTEFLAAEVFDSEEVKDEGRRGA